MGEVNTRRFCYSKPFFVFFPANVYVHARMTTVFPTDVLGRAREFFPYLSSGRIYLNHAGTSPQSTRVVEALTSHTHDRSTGVIDTFRSDVAMVETWRRTIAGLINAEAPERIAFQMNTSDALNLVAAGLPWKSGDRVLVNDAEFPANLHPFLHLRRHGVEVDMISARDGAVTADHVARALTPRTRLASLSAVQFLSGYRADMAAIGELCRSRGTLFVVDGIQAVGAVPVDVQAMKIDALAAGAQKWQMAPLGTGFLYLTADMQERITQQHLGWLSVASPWEFHRFDQPPAASARRYEGGTLNIPGMHAMLASVSLLLEFGIDAIAGHLHHLTAILLRECATVPGVVPVTPLDPARRAGIATVAPPPGIPPEDIFRSLRARGITCAVREGLLRFSPHFYNTPGEMETTARVFAEICASPAAGQPTDKRDGS